MVIVIKEKMIRFMQGRYGSDQFSKFLLIISIALMGLSLITGKQFFYIVAILLLLYTYMRIFSKKFEKRYQENQRYLKYVSVVTAIWRTNKEKIAQNKHYHIYKCPKCKQKIRIPRGKGKVAITCPKCHTEFQKRSWWRFVISFLEFTILFG